MYVSKKQARTMDGKRIKQAIAACRNERELTMLLLSLKAGLRAMEIAGLTWGNIEIDTRCDHATLLLKTTKGRKPRNVPIADDLRDAILAYRATRAGRDGAAQPVFVNRHSKPGQPLSANAVSKWFFNFYSGRLGWEGYSGHSGRRTFATQIARRLGSHGLHFKDLQALLGHERMQSTALYIDTNEEAQRLVVNAI